MRTRGSNYFYALGWLTKAWFIIALGLSIAISGQLPGASSAQAADSKYFYVQSYGEGTFRDTNFDPNRHNRYVGWWETKLVLDLKSQVKDNALKVLTFDPYLKATLALSDKSMFWENNLIYGLGLENRFLTNLNMADYPYLDWLKNLRFYAELLYITYLADSAREGILDNDVRIGFGLWKEWNIPPAKMSDSMLWGEVWSDVNWRNSNFSDFSDDSVFFGLMSRVGLKLFSPKRSRSLDSWSVYYLPYAVVDISASDNDFYWENRISAGAGFRVMPVYTFSDEKGEAAANMLIFRFFAEWLNAVDYWRGDPDPDTPHNDFRIGINFSYNLF